jgi:hypothetical protein
MHRPRASRPGRCRPCRAAQPLRWPHAPTPRRLWPVPPVTSPINGASSPPCPPLLFPLLSSLVSARPSTPSPLLVCPCRPPLLVRASPSPLPPPAAGLVDALPSHQSSAAAMECCRAGPFSPPHHHRPSSVRTPPPHLARHNHRRSPVESLLGVLHLGHRKSRATAPTRGDRTERTCAAPAGMGWLGRWARPPVPGLRLKCRSSTVRQFSDFQFSFNIPEIHINFKNS